MVFVFWCAEWICLVKLCVYKLKKVTWSSSSQEECYLKNHSKDSWSEEFNRTWHCPLQFLPERRNYKQNFWDFWNTVFDFEENKPPKLQKLLAIQTQKMAWLKDNRWPLSLTAIQKQKFENQLPFNPHNRHLLFRSSKKNSLTIILSLSSCSSLTAFKYCNKVIWVSFWFCVWDSKHSCNFQKILFNQWRTMAMFLREKPSPMRGSPPQGYKSVPQILFNLMR